MNELNNTRIKTIEKKPCYIFKIENFLTDKFYDELRLSFPAINNYEELLNNRNDKFSINSEDNVHYNKYLKHNLPFLKLKKLVESDDFFNLFNKSLRQKFIESRESSFIELIKIIRPMRYMKPQNRVSNFFCNVKSKIQYSYILNKGKIVPHTDEVAKLLSLMIYFPENEDEEKIYGTTFWDSNNTNFINKHLNSTKEQKLFFPNAKEIFKTSFEKNVLYGFVKNSKSWHSVEPADLHPNYVRKSININFFI